MLISNEIYVIILAGAIGALTAELIKDNCIELPKKIGTRFSLGIFGCVIIGAIAGFFIDGSPITAFMGGYMGPQMLSAILKTKLSELDMRTVITKPAQAAEVEIQPEFTDIETMIRWKATRAGVSPDLAVAVAKCESALETNAVNVNKTGSKDRGLYQWNDKYHPEITDKMAFDPEIATDLFLKAVKENHINWWDASKPCWKDKA